MKEPSLHVKSSVDTRVQTELVNMFFRHFTLSEVSRLQSTSSSEMVFLNLSVTLVCVNSSQNSAKSKNKAFLLILKRKLILFNELTRLHKSCIIRVCVGRRVLLFSLTVLRYDFRGVQSFPQHSICTDSAFFQPFKGMIHLSLCGEDQITGSGTNMSIVLFVFFLLIHSLTCFF